MFLGKYEDYINKLKNKQNMKHIISNTFNDSFLLFLLKYFLTFNLSICVRYEN